MAVSGGSPRMPPRLLRDVVGCLLVLLLHACSSRRADSLAVHFNGLEPGVISYTNTSWDGFSSREVRMPCSAPCSLDGSQQPRGFPALPYPPYESPGR